MSDDLRAWIQLAANVGFPAVVAWYLLVHVRRTMEALTAAVRQLASGKGCRYNPK